MIEAGQDGLKGLTAPLIAAGGKSAQRIAVVALPPCDDVAALRPSGLYKILPGKFQRRFYCLGPAGYKIDMIQIAGRAFGQKIG